MQIIESKNVQSSWLDNFLGQYSSHGLNDLHNAQLMNRVDTKFMVPTRVLPELLDQLTDHFTALEINGRRLFQYESTYFDTPNLHFYHMHHNGRLNRFKIRFRDYVDTEARFLEVKFKSNKKRTIKSRIHVPSDEIFLIDNYSDFLQSQGVPYTGNLRPTLINRYQRLALANEERAERLTIDTNLHNSTNACDPIALGPIAILELKQARLTRSSPVFQLLRSWHIRPRSFSKYCMGLALAQDNMSIKTNRFKKLLRFVQTSQNSTRLAPCLP